MHYTPNTVCLFVLLGADESGFLQEAVLMFVKNDWAGSNKHIEL